MIKELFALASEFETKALSKTAAKERVSRGKISKQLEKAKADYGRLKDSLDVMEANDAKLKSQLDETRKSTNEARQRILKMHKAMQNMDLSNANDAIFYNDESQDVGYVIDGKEFHLDIDDTGEVKLTPMGKHRKARKAPKQEEQKVEDTHCADDECGDESHGHEGKEKEEDFDSLYASLVE